MSGGIRQFQWTVGALEDLRQLNSISGDLGQMANVLGASRQDIDHALWMLLGRTPAEALAAMKRREAA